MKNKLSSFLKTKITVADFIIISAVVGLSFLLGLLPGFLVGRGETFVVSCPEMTAEYSLYENRTIELGYADIVVEDGTVRVEDSTCRDGICENEGRISRAGESIICVPNRLKITVSGNSEVDAVAE